MSMHYSDCSIEALLPLFCTLALQRYMSKMKIRYLLKPTKAYNMDYLPEIKRNRCYSTNNELASWKILNCAWCGKFLKKTQRLHCSNCQSKLYTRSTPRRFN